MCKPSITFAIMAATAVVLLTGSAFAGANTNLPFSDNFESYAGGTPLINGLNGWYGSSNAIVVQTNTVSTGTNAAMIPTDCTLSNRFQNSALTNVWIQMDVRPRIYDKTNLAVVDTNVAALFYINSNGNFVVHNGPATNPSPNYSASWVTATNGGIGTSRTNWATLQIRVNYANQTWGLFNITTNGRVLVTNNIGFVNQSLTSFAGFGVNNSGISTSYIDNVMVTNAPPQSPFFDVMPAITTNSVMRGFVTNSILTITNLSSTNISWSATNADAWIQIASPASGALAGGGSTNLLVTNSAVTLAAGTYTSSVAVLGTSIDPDLDPQHVAATFVLHVMELHFAPSQLTNAIMQGETALTNFQLWTTNQGIMNYSVSVDQPWLALSTPGGSQTGSLTGPATNTILVIYTNTAALAVGDYSGTITIAAAGGWSTNLQALLSVRAMPMLSVSPPLETSSVMEGQNLAPQPLLVWNGSADDAIGYQVTTNQGGASTNWLSVAVTNLSGNLAPLATNTLTINYAVSSLMSAGIVPSNYNGLITLTATNVNGYPTKGSPAIVPVTVKVNPKSRMALSLTNLSQTILQGQDAASQGFDVWNANGFYTLEYTVSKGTTPWLVLSPTSGTSTGQHQRVEVQYSTVNLPVGRTNATISIVGWAFDGVHPKVVVETQTVEVALLVTPFASLMTDAQPAYAYTVRKGLTPPDTVFSVWNAANPADAMFFTVTPSASWLSATPASGTSTGNPVTVRVQADPTGLKPGIIYSGTVTINATDAGSGKPAYGSPIVFTITVTIRDFKGFDFQGGVSGASDLVLYREVDGTWEIRNLLSNYATSQFLGGAGYQAVPGDYNGDGITEMGVYRPASGGWYARRVDQGSTEIIGGVMKQWSGAEYVGLPGDYDGDGKTDPAVYLENTGLWMVLMSGNGYQQVSGILGGPGFSALPAGDYDGDMKVDPGVYNRATGLWIVLLSSTSYALVSGMFGGDGFVPVPTDYDGDGITDPAVYEMETGLWYVLPSTSLTSQGYGLAIYQLGGTALSATLVPAPGNYGGVGSANLALYDTTTWRWYITTLDGVPVAWGYPMGSLGFMPVLP